jgi:negative regulator of replication initiation
LIKKFTNDNKISVCYVVDRLRQILDIKEYQKQQNAIDNFKNELIHDMGVNQMCQEVKVKGEGKC